MHEAYERVGISESCPFCFDFWPHGEPLMGKQKADSIEAMSFQEYSSSRTI
jgi:hypothetical protein